ncbi:DUF3899 domain-containing protein [Bacillus sp. BRMEA1]|uniref:DUF3899 domain-containing protein n=1 Tax=Neobacillus endophyticus TaxID=2738405 RepID=UPI00156649D3|nr:DUF3899 domain-containing protein [Neobacillus endophyticus]NRD78430.1 DUF3899 domain-containing protein [Neobacillus endophyticus]
MNFLHRKRMLLVTLTQAVIFLLSFIFYHKISLLSYINISFYISAVLLLFSLLVYTIQSGFYDVISRSLNFAASLSRGNEKRKFSDVPALSELVTINNKPLLFHGLINGSLMLIALLIYYVLLT